MEEKEEKDEDDEDENDDNYFDNVYNHALPYPFPGM